MQRYVKSRHFTNSTGPGDPRLVRAADLQRIYRNVRLLDELSYRSMDLFASSGGLIGGTPGLYDTRRLPFSLWPGAIRWRSSMTTLYIDGASSRASNEVVRVYLNGSGTAVATITPTGIWSATIDLTGRGYVDGQVVTVDIRLEGNNSTGDISSARHVIREVAAGPVPKPGDSYPGVPAFTTVLDADKLNQLTGAIDWLWRRIKLVPIPAGLVQLYAQGPCGTSALDLAGVPLGFYGVRRNYSADTARVRGQVNNLSSPQLRAYITLNGSTVWTGPTWGVGTQTLDATISLSGISVGSQAHIGVYAQVLSAGPRETWKHSRWSFNTRTLPAAGAYYPYAELPPWPSTDYTYTGEELRDMLNDLAGVVAGVKSRLDATPWVWDRVRGVRQYFAWTPGSDDIMPARARPRFERQGQRLFVAGKDVSLATGQRTIPTSDKGIDWERYSYTYNESLLGGETRGTATVYLDPFDTFLQRGDFYLLTGDVLYAEELI